MNIEKKLLEILEVLGKVTPEQISYELKVDLVKKTNEAINYTRCCETLNLEVKPTFKEWLTTNFSKYDNEYYQDKNKNGIWKKHQLYKLYEDITKL